MNKIFRQLIPAWVGVVEKTPRYGHLGDSIAQQDALWEKS
ncbi:hypothetical protein FHT28_002852 [Rhizobium sp. SG570]|nr:hypothetical protein [Rhizobium sp. SG741]NKJ36119.1 hypothetical protein [Rhizobium sp. SG570]